MAKKMYKKIAYIIIFTIGCAAFSFAQNRADIHNPVSIGAQVGFQKAADADNGNLMYGALVRVKLTNAVGFEGSINYRQEEYDNNEIKVSNWPVHISGLFYPVEDLYGVVGVGWYNTSIKYSGSLSGVADKTSQKFGWHFGAGLDIPLSEKAYLFGDFRYVFLNYNFTDVPSGGEISSDFFMINAGLMFAIN
jgi:opacity protein-like surface antigen